MVNFTETDEFDVVPLQWLTDGQKRAYYPPKNRYSQMGLEKAIKSGALPESAWLTYAVKVVKTSGKSLSLSKMCT